MEASMLEQLEPKQVFHYFEEICKIPHGSGNTKQISDYLKGFAKERGLYCRQDEWNNIVIIKEATSGYESHEPVILQGHMDMVAVKEADCTLDLEKDGLQLQILGDRLAAKKTSLGGDDGISLALGLALLDGAEYHHPRLELVFTVEEEVGMEGASALSVGDLTAKRMINLDQEEEGIFIAGCAGGARVDIQKGTSPEQREGMLCKLEINGLQGGHSGQEINKERGNAICLMGRLLGVLQGKASVFLRELWGGTADNAIPSSCSASLVVTSGEGSHSQGKDFEEEIRTFLEKQIRGIQEEFQGKEKQIEVTFDILVGKDEEQAEKYEVCSLSDSRQWIHLLNAVPHGVIANSVKMKGLVETSLNPGILRVTPQSGILSTSVRSSNQAAKEALIGQLSSLAALAGGTVGIRGDYPGWDFDPNSKLLAGMSEIYCQMYGEKPQVEAIHAGLECGIFQSKIKGLDCVSIGPDMEDIHTTRETLSIPSVKRVWDYLLRVLESL